MTKNKILIAALLGLFLVGAKYFDYSSKRNKGYCFAEKRLITDDELVDVAVTHLLGNLEREYQSLAPEEQVKRIRYNTLEEFYKMQPKCCGVSGDNGESKYPPKPARIWYKESFSRTILYQYRKDGNEKYRGLVLVVPFCGEGVFVHKHHLSGPEDKWNVGDPTHISPHSKYHEKANIRGNMGI